MRITLLTNSDLPSVMALNYLLPTLAQSHQVQVFLSGQVGRSPRLPELAMLKFFEQRLYTEILFPALDPVAPGERPMGFAGLAAALAIPILPLDGINEGPGLQRFRESSPDLVLSIRYGGILLAPALEVPPLGVLNLHSGLLPTYRGVMATFRAMLDSASSMGTTLHYIRDASIDTGDVVDQRSLPLNYHRSYLGNVLDLYPSGCEMLLAAVDSLSRGGSLTTRPQDPGGHYYSFPNEAELARFYARGLRLYDVEEAIEVARSFVL